MSKNIIFTKGHHVYKYDPPEYTEDNVPVYSKGNKKIVDGKDVYHHPFLGKGYYFWDDNFGRAKSWGKQKYHNKLKIREYDLKLEGDSFLDLVGSREDLWAFIKTLKFMWEKRGQQMPINKSICALLKMEKKNPGSFPFKIIRALNFKKANTKVPFSENDLDDSFMMDPEIIICFFNKKDIPLSYRIVI